VFAIDDHALTCLVTLHGPAPHSHQALAAWRLHARSSSSRSLRRSNSPAASQSCGSVAAAYRSQNPDANDDSQGIGAQALLSGVASGGLAAVLGVGAYYAVRQLLEKDGEEGDD